MLLPTVMASEALAGSLPRELPGPTHERDQSGTFASLACLFAPLFGLKRDTVREREGGCVVEVVQGEVGA